MANTPTSQKKVTSIVILPTKQSFTSPPKRYIEAKIPLKSLWIEPFGSFWWNFYDRIMTQLGTAAAPTAFWQRQDMSERMARVEQALVEIRSALKVKTWGWLDVVRGNYLGCHDMWDFINTLWLCQNSYWKWPFIESFPIKNGDFP